MLREFDTAVGPGRLHTHPAAGEVRLHVLLSHGAGGGVGARDLVKLADVLPEHGVTVHLLEQPWRVAGRAIATAPPTLDVALLAALELVPDDAPVVLGGRSAGARSACRTAATDQARAAGVVGVLALSFPLHPPGKPEKSRATELTGAGVETLVVQGERDAMGRPEEFPQGTDLVVVPGADHGLKVGARAVPDQAACLELIAASTVTWLDQLLARTAR